MDGTQIYINTEQYNTIYANISKSASNSQLILTELQQIRNDQNNFYDKKLFYDQAQLWALAFIFGVLLIRLMSIAKNQRHFW